MCPFCGFFPPRIHVSFLVNPSFTSVQSSPSAAAKSPCATSQRHCFPSSIVPPTSTGSVPMLAGIAAVSAALVGLRRILLSILARGILWLLRASVALIGGGSVALGRTAVLAGRGSTSPLALRRLTISMFRRRLAVAMMRRCLTVGRLGRALLIARLRRSTTTPTAVVARRGA